MTRHANPFPMEAYKHAPRFESRFPSTPEELAGATMRVKAAVAEQRAQIANKQREFLMKDKRMLCVRLSLNEAISELQDMAIDYPALRGALESFAAEIGTLRDRCTAGFGTISPPLSTQEQEDMLDSDPRVIAHQSEAAE